MSHADDPEFYLPAASSTRLRALRHAREAAHAAVKPAQERYRHAVDDQERAERDLARFVKESRNLPPSKDGGKLTETHVQRLEQEVLACKQKVATELREYERAQTAWTAASQIAARCEAFLEKIGRRAAVGYVPPPGSEKAFADPLAELSAVRERMVSIKSALTLAEQAPRPIAEAKAAMRDMIAHLAKDASPFLDCFISYDAGESFRITGSTEEAKQAWLFHDLIVARLDAALDDEYQKLQPPLKAKAREQEIKRLHAELLQAEREEEDIVLSCMARGQLVARRPNVDPRALLSLADSCPALKSIG